MPAGPRELTAARRVPSGQASGADGMRSRAAPDSISGCGCGQPVPGGIVPATIAVTVLIRLATPAAARACPMHAETAPSAATSVPPWRSRVSMASSVASASVVPAPCPSTMATSEGPTPARSYAWRSARESSSLPAGSRPPPVLVRAAVVQPAISA